MKSHKNIFIAFILNLFFSIFELVGGFISGSVAILSDSLHDFGDSISIGFSFIFEKISKRRPDKKYSCGYARFSVMGSLLTSSILVFGSIFVIYSAVQSIITPRPINYDKMIIFAIVGFLVNLIATLVTRKGHSLNEKAVNLHMLEDLFGWIIVLIGSIVMRFTNFYLLDPILSIVLALFILLSALKNLKTIACIFLEKTPSEIDIDHVKKEIKDIEEVTDVHHVHVWSMDGNINFATMHVVVKNVSHEIKHEIKNRLKNLNIHHATIELESENENCLEIECHQDFHCHNIWHCHHHH